MDKISPKCLVLMLHNNVQPDWCNDITRLKRISSTIKSDASTALNSWSHRYSISSQVLSIKLSHPFRRNSKNPIGCVRGTILPVNKRSFGPGKSQHIFITICDREQQKRDAFAYLCAWTPRIHLFIGGENSQTIRKPIPAHTSVSRVAFLLEPTCTQCEKRWGVEDRISILIVDGVHCINKGLKLN